MLACVAGGFLHVLSVEGLVSMKAFPAEGLCISWTCPAFLPPWSLCFLTGCCCVYKKAMFHLSFAPGQFVEFPYRLCFLLATMASAGNPSVVAALS